MHSLARRACIENALFFQFPRKIRGELKVLIKTAQHQNLRRELVWCWQFVRLRIGLPFQG